MIKIGSWNIEGRLSPISKKGRGSTENILHSISSLNADVLFLPEAYCYAPIDESIDEILRGWGYSITDVPYEEDRPPRENETLYMRLLSRVAIESLTVNRLGDMRNSLEIEIKDPDTNLLIRIIGIHLDDRAEELRQRQLEDLIPVINRSNLPTIMVGDYNAMHGTTKKAAFLRSPIAAGLAKAVPNKDMRSFVERAIGMATGSVLATIESETNLRDADIRKRPTTTPKVRDYDWLPSIPLIDIDHTMRSDSIYIDGYEIGAHDMGADHRSISGYVSVIE